MNAYDKQFEKRKEIPECWYNKSSDLLISARVLWRAMKKNQSLEVNCWATYTMLIGMSFELLLKAHCISKGKCYKKSHNLIDLATTAGVLISKKEKGILKVLTEYIIWDGRYPTPKHAKHLADHWENERKILMDEVKNCNLTAFVNNENLDFDLLLRIWRRWFELHN